MRVLIDADMGAANLAAARKMGIDLLMLTHCHTDHRLTRREITDVPIEKHLARLAEMGRVRQENDRWIKR